MSGHSHWSTIRRKKEVEDKKRGKIFAKLARAITIAVGEGGGVIDPQNNPKLRLAINQAQKENMPKDKIIKAIQRAEKDKNAQKLEKVIYGAYCFGNKVVFLIEAITDNRNRTLAQIRKIVESAGATFANYEAIIPLFKKVGIIQVAKKEREEEECFELAAGLGADDYELDGENLILISSPEKIEDIAKRVEERGEEVLSSQLGFRERATVAIEDKEQKEKLKKLVNSLLEHEEVENIFTNANI